MQPFVLCRAFVILYVQSVIVLCREVECPLSECPLLHGGLLLATEAEIKKLCLPYHAHSNTLL